MISWYVVMVAEWWVRRLNFSATSYWSYLKIKNVQNIRMMDGCMHGWMGGWTLGWTDGWIDAWKDGWADESEKESSSNMATDVTREETDGVLGFAFLFVTRKPMILWSLNWPPNQWSFDLWTDLQSNREFLPAINGFVFHSCERLRNNPSHQPTLHVVSSYPLGYPMHTSRQHFKSRRICKL